MYVAKLPSYFFLVEMNLAQQVSIYVSWMGRHAAVFSLDIFVDHLERFVSAIELYFFKPVSKESPQLFTKVFIER